MDQQELADQIQRMANLGNYETDLVNGTWTGSPNFLRIFGLPNKKTFTVDEFQALVHPEDVDRVMAHFSDCLSKQQDFNYEYRCIHHTTGKTLYVVSRSKIEYAPDATPLRIHGIKQDITAQKEREIKLEQLNETVRQKNEVLGSVAHDLRAPIHQIKGLIGLWQETESPKEQQSIIDLISSACDNSIEMINELVEIAEMDEKKSEFRFHQEFIAGIIKESILRFKQRAGTKNIGIQRSLDKSITAPVVRNQLARLVDNLLSNAVKFTDRNGRINVTLKREGNGYYIISVQDNGMGIPEDKQESLIRGEGNFNRSGTEGERSTGFGFRIMAEILEVHNAAMNIESTEGSGTRIEIRIPVNPQSANANGSKPVGKVA